MLPITAKVKGFTLIEILIAIFISGLIFTMLIFGLKTMINQYQGLQKNQKSFKQLQMNMLQIQQDMEFVQPRKITDETGKVLPVFVGKNNAMEFTTLQGKVVRHAYLFDKDKNTLVLRTWAVLDRVNSLEYKDKILFTQVKEFSLQYIDDKKNISMIWPANSQQTTQQNSLPQTQEAQQNTDYPIAVIITLDLTNRGKMTRYFLVKKSV
jgi:type II secretion system protein J